MQDGYSDYPGVFPHMQKIKIIPSPKQKRSETDIIKHCQTTTCCVALGW